MHVLRPPRLRLGRRAIAAMLGAATLAAVVPAAALATAPAAGAATSCTTTWKVPGANGQFDQASNWSNGVPTNTSDVCLPASATPYSVVMLATASVHGLDVGSGATLYLESNATNGAVNLTISGGLAANAGTIEIVNADTLAHQSSFTINGTRLQNDGTVRVDAHQGLAIQLLAMALHNTATGTLDIAGGTELYQLDNDGFVTVGTGATLNVEALPNYTPATHTLSRGQFDLAGVIQWPNADVVTLDAAVSVTGNGGVLDPVAIADGLHHLRTITANGSFSVGDGVTPTFGPITNNGRVSIGGNGASITTNGDYTQAGSFYTSFSQGSELVTIGGSVLVKSGALVGDGDVYAPVVNSGGTLYPAPQISVHGNYTQGALGTIATRIGGPVGTGTVDVTGTAALGGTLAVTLDSSVAPQPGRSWLLVTAGTRTGAFASITSPGLAAPYQFVGTTGTTGMAVVLVANYDDTNYGVTYQGWHGLFFGTTPTSTTRWSCTTPGDTATFTFTGTAITWNTWRGTQMGIAQVLIDGVNKGNVDTYAATAAPFAKTYTGLTATKHTITIKTLGTKNAQSQNPCIVVDSLKVGTTVTEDTSSAIVWSGWTGVAGTNGYHAASAAGKSAQISSSLGDGIEWLTRTGPNMGKAQLLLDGQPLKIVDLYAAAAHTGVDISVPVLQGTHTLTIKVLGTKNAASTGTTVVVDGFIAH